MVACTLALALFVAACGSDDDSGDSSGGADTGASSDAGGGTIDVPKKTIVYGELVGDASEIAKRHGIALKEGAAALGWDVKHIQGGGDIPAMIKGLTGAINAGGDAVIVSSTDAPVIQPVVQLAKQKGIPFIADGGETAESDLFTARYQESEETMSKLLTEQMIKDLDDKGTLGVLDNSQIGAGKLRQAGREKALEGSGIETVSRTDSDLADLVGGSKKAVSAMLAKTPDLNALWLVYDAMMPPALEATNQRNNTTAKVYSWFANPSNLEVMRKNKNVQALVDNNFEHMAMISLDQLARHFKDGDDLSATALADCPLQYKVVTRDDIPPAGEAVFPVDEAVKPFVENWKSGKFGEGADCGS
jgi:ABC-type sugar transport system substrate-binding protein